MPSSLNLIAAKLRRALSLLPYLPRTLGLVWNAAPGWTVAWVVLLAVQATFTSFATTGMETMAASLLTDLGVLALIDRDGARGAEVPWRWSESKTAMTASRSAWVSGAWCGERSMENGAVRAMGVA